MRISYSLLLSIFASLVSSSNHFQRLAKDLTVYDYLGYFGDLLPSKYHEFFSKLMHAVPERIKSKVNVPIKDSPYDDAELSLSERLDEISLQKDPGTMFIKFEQDDTQGYSIVYFYKDAILRIAFLVEDVLVGGGKAVWAREGIDQNSMDTYKFMADILSHPQLSGALFFLEDKYKFDSNIILDAMISASFELEHKIKTKISEYPTNGGQHHAKMISFSVVPSKIRVDDDHLVIERLGIIEYKSLSRKDIFFLIFLMLLFFAASLYPAIAGVTIPSE